MKNVFSIAPVLPFADTLAAGLLEQNGFDPARLAKTVLFLPTRRACRTVHEAFLRQSGGKPLMLPRMIPFSAVENDETQGRLCLLNAVDLPDAISPLRRRLLLGKLIRKRAAEPVNAEKALKLADALAEFLDESYIENVPFDRLKNLVPDEFAGHWQETLRFLEIVTAAWPEILKEEGVIDAADRQVRLFAAQSALWRETPPDFPVVAAGSTGSQPATAELLDTIASMENGTVVLPGVDMLLDEESFQACEPSHPQYNLKRLLDKMGIKRADVRPFRPDDGERSERLRLISEAMRPAATTDKWRTAEKFTAAAVDGVKMIDCANVQEEAAVIALTLREVLETPEKTAALITPDRALARRVVAEMNRWGIVMDDSAGTNLYLTGVGTFLMLAGQAALNNQAPFDFLACLKHPMALCGKTFAVFRPAVRRFELKFLHGKRPGDGFAGLKAAAGNADDADAANFIDDLERRTGGFTRLMTDPAAHDFETLLDAHLAAAEQLAQSADRSGADRLWAGDAGEAAAAFLAGLKEQAALIDPVTPAEYLALLSALFKGVTVRPKYGMHPRLDILGTMEARLIQPDVLILGGLNEGTWPKTPDADPWLSRPMREQCGLPSPERKIALSAHDFAQAFCAENLVLTRSVKQGGTPGIPSRWLMRLQTVLGISGLALPAGDQLNWAREIDAPAAALSFLPPQPVPPVAARPRELSVTRIETLMRDPYSIYARFILHLQKLDGIDKAFDAADYGTIVHKAVETFCTRHPSRLPADPETEILAIGDELFKELNFSQTERAFWKPRLDSALIWFVEQQKKRADGIEHIFCEQEGNLSFQTKAGDFRLRCFADRVDATRDGACVLIDYKTGLPPSNTSVFAGYSPQLPLEAAILRRGGFERIGARPVASAQYWRLRGKQDGGSVRSVTATVEETDKLADEALDRLKDLIDAYDDPATPYLATPDTSVSLKYNDYDHLARFDEWAAFDDADEPEEE